MIEPNKMILKILIVILNLYLLNSCGFLTKKVESLATPAPISNYELESIKNIKKNLYCYENNKLQLLFEDDSTLKYYRSFMSEIFEKKSFSFIQKAAMLSLIEMSRRPDKASPSARLQFFLRLNGKDFYYDFFPKNLEDNNKMSYLKGLDVLLKTFDKSKTLSTLAENLDKILPKNTNVSSDLEAFLQNSKSDIIKNDFFSNTFLKGDEILTKHESFKRSHLAKIIKIYNTDAISNNNFYDFTKNSLLKSVYALNDLTLKCNFDINKENPLKEEFSLNNSKKSHNFALKEGDNFFIAVSSVLIKRPLKNIDSTPFFKSYPSPTPLPICQFNNSIQDIVLFSSEGRNPDQHLKHLISYDINSIDSFRSLNELLKFSRHLFLSNPDRILYESKRGRKSQLDFFLSMNFPIYHIDSLGDIIGFGVFANNSHKEKSLIADDRNKARLWCAP